MATSDKAQSDKAQLSALGYEGSYNRSMTVWSALALGFTYLSPLVAIYALFGFGLMIGGPGSIFWILIVGGGQMLVALVMGEVVSQFPIAGGIYPWMRRLAGRRTAWLTAWVYVWAMLVTIASVAQYGTGFLATVLGVTEVSPELTLILAISLLVVALLINLGGTKTLARIAVIGLGAELVGVVGLGLYLLLFERQNEFSIFTDGFASADYGAAFVGAALVGLFMFYGFEACGDVAEEVGDAAREVPKAMILTILVGGLSALASFAGYVLAASPELLAATAAGENADPIGTILKDVLGDTGARLFLVVAVVAFISCCLSLQAAASRLLHSFARDKMLPASGWLGKISDRSKIPTNALLVASIIPMLLCVVIYANPASLVPITAFAVLGIYIAFQSVVLASLIQRFRGWKPAGPWSLGSLGILVNIAALAYGVWAILWLLQPGASGDWFIDNISIIGVVAVFVPGLLYLLIARPYLRSKAPYSDAIEVAKKMRAGN
jgi:amino acid transporter